MGTIFEMIINVTILPDHLVEPNFIKCHAHARYYEGKVDFAKSVIYNSFSPWDILKPVLTGGWFSRFEIPSIHTVHTYHRVSDSHSKHVYYVLNDGHGWHIGKYILKYKTIKKNIEITADTKMSNT